MRIKMNFSVPDGSTQPAVVCQTAAVQRVGVAAAGGASTNVPSGGMVVPVQDC